MDHERKSEEKPSTETGSQMDRALAIANAEIKINRLTTSFENS